MHYHAEVWIPSDQDVQANVKRIMAPFEETHEQGFWDWYQVGGRWSGAHVPTYAPEKDPRNIEACGLCEGTGDRPGWVQYVDGKRTFADDWAEKMNGCNGCHGTGKQVTWPTQWAPFPGDIMPVQEIRNDLTCYTLVLGEEVLHRERYVPAADPTKPGEIVPTEFDGNVKKALAARGITTGFLVTVDYHR